MRGEEKEREDNGDTGELWGTKNGKFHLITNILIRPSYIKTEGQKRGKKKHRPSPVLML